MPPFILFFLTLRQLELVHDVHLKHRAVFFARYPHRQNLHGRQARVEALQWDDHEHSQVLWHRLVGKSTSEMQNRERLLGCLRLRVPRQKLGIYIFVLKAKDVEFRIQAQTVRIVREVCLGLGARV